MLTILTGKVDKSPFKQGNLLKFNSLSKQICYKIFSVTPVTNTVIGVVTVATINKECQIEKFSVKI